MRRAHFGRLAETDLTEIYDYIAKSSPVAAGKLIDRIEAAVFRLVEFPGMGHERADVLDPRYRFWSVGRYVIAYYFDDSSLTVVRIVAGERDFAVLFP